MRAAQMRKICLFGQTVWLIAICKPTPKTPKRQHPFWNDPIGIAKYNPTHHFAASSNGCRKHMARLRIYPKRRRNSVLGRKRIRCVHTFYQVDIVRVVQLKGIVDLDHLQQFHANIGPQIVIHKRKGPQPVIRKFKRRGFIRQINRTQMKLPRQSPGDISIVPFRLRHAIFIHQINRTFKNRVIFAVVKPKQPISPCLLKDRCQSLGVKQAMRQGNDMFRLYVRHNVSAHRKALEFRNGLWQVARYICVLTMNIGRF